MISVMNKMIDDALSMSLVDYYDIQRNHCAQVTIYFN